ncbi:hypothetical protein [Bradyrhizobium elkanii]|uniref:hypothetical protein n=1 Tax=Bradyrhizobium elkanii TaxID=29448 RepID=UPI001449805F|nr:hypothetical protein [Bradyrhizobium elkanii]MCP1932496.1 hypothetical protein [Bradyrhizobium elkanii]MCS3479577.1 hypothetical protein [Bradyrhizobium elkanii]MCS3576965.1 hypothetical protein [Bradyrhizobium elkanii]MCS3719842.1 hypothetical protein [Bradyrhizobium elkanii]MCS4004259.1 hypothetical protein [Bradyrhizobium elkanii USDA 61]
MLFKTGDRVICIDDSPTSHDNGSNFVLLRPRYGEEYIVRGVHYEPDIKAQGVFLEGLENPSIVWADGTEHEWPFDGRRFRLASCLLKLPSKAYAST